MSEYVTLECKHCGNAERSEFIVRKGEYICKCCGRCYKEKAADEETRLAIAYESLKNYEFEFAERTFSDIINDYPNSVDARWGVLLARYGIVFVKGFYMEEVEPIYCFPNYAYKKGSFKTETEYREIERLLGGDIERMYLYGKQADEIERAFKMFADDVGKKENDVFICVKISKTTAANPYEKGRTEDYEKAHELYDKLRSRGKNVFFSYVTLKNSIDSDMEIWRNMLKSRKMLIIGSRAEYLNSVWVKSEWERWLMLDKADEKAEHRKNLYIYILGNESENLYSKLPTGLKRLHPQIYTKTNEADLINDICGAEESKPAGKTAVKNKKAVEHAPVTEKNDVAENVEPYVSFLGGRIEKLTAKSTIRYSGRADVEKVVLPEGINKIEAGFFSNCANLIYIKIPQSVKTIEAGAFSGCQKLASIEIPQGVTVIESDTFYMCKRLTSVKFPEGLQSIGDRAFMHCEGLKSIELPVSVTYIGDKAFSTCYKLKQISIPDSITYIGEEALDNKEELKIIYSGTIAEFYAIPKKLYFGRCTLICPKDPKTLIGRIGNIFLVSLYAAMIIAAVIVGFTVEGSLPWVISIPASISVNILFAFLDKKIEAFNEVGLFWASLIELVACAALAIFGNISPWMLACYAGVSIGIVVANAFAIKLLNDSSHVSCIFLGAGGIFISFGIMFWPSLLGIALFVIGVVAIIGVCFFADS